MYPSFLLFVLGVAGSNINIATEIEGHYPFIKHFKEVQSILMIDLDGADTTYSDKLMQNLMEYGKTPCIMSCKQGNVDGNNQSAFVEMVQTYLISWGRNTGSFICMSTPNLDHILNEPLKDVLIPILKNPTVFVFYGMDISDSSSVEDVRPELEIFFEKVWTVLEIPEPIGVIPTHSGESIMCTYDIEQWVNGTYGRGIRFFTDDLLKSNENILTNERIYEMYPLKVSFFERFPTSFQLQEPKPKLLNKLSSKAWGYSGLDAFIMGDTIGALKMNATIHDLGPGDPYGYIYSNGTVGGSLGEIVNMKADIAFNSRFVTSYGSKIDDRYEFLNYIHNDRLCMIVTKAGAIPLWHNVGRVYSYWVWCLLLMQTMTISLLRWLQQKLARRRSYSLIYAIIETHAIILVPLPRVTSAPARERLLIVLCLVMNVILVSVFQGNLHATFNARKTYPDINTMEELDVAELEFSVSQGFRDVFDVFEGSNSPTYRSLSSKIHRGVYLNNSLALIAQGAAMASLARESDIKLYMKLDYADPTGLPLLHIVNDCPRSYQLAYIVSRKFPFTTRVDDLMRRLVEAGLPAWYYQTTEHTIAAHLRVLAGVHARDASAALRVQHVAGALGLLAAGTLLALVTLLAELLVFSANKRRLARAHFEFVH